eukprot:4315201-Prorocentrum_lima.AAC.1
MTSSLVGSEMCIRDSLSPVEDDPARRRSRKNAEKDTPRKFCESFPLRAVSYTHLTLPTICSV